MEDNDDLKRKNVVLKQIREGRSFDFLIEKFPTFTIQEIEDIIKESEELSRKVDDELDKFNLHYLNYNFKSNKYTKVK